MKDYTMSVVSVQTQVKITPEKLRSKIGKYAHVVEYGSIDDIGYVLQLNNSFKIDGCRTITINDYTVRLSDTAKTVLRDNFGCSCCKTVATHYVLHRDSLHKHISYSIAFFHINDGDLIFHTKDHIVPRSLGGKDNFSNYQGMCYTCNQLKGDSLSDLDKAKATEALKVLEDAKAEEDERKYHSHDTVNVAYFKKDLARRVYTKMKIVFTKDECIRIHRGKIFSNKNISIMDDVRLQQLTVAEKAYLLQMTLVDEVEDNLSLPWYLKPFKKIIVKRVKSTMEHDSLIKYKDTYDKMRSILDQRNNL